MTPTSKKCFILLGVLMCFVVVVHAGGIKLRYGFQSGKQYKCWMAIESTTLEDSSKNTIPSDIRVGVRIGVTLNVEKALEGEQFSCLISLDTIIVQTPATGGAMSSMPLANLRGKSMRMILDTRGINRGTPSPDSVSSKQTSQAVGFDPLSGELLNRMSIFLEFPENSLEVGQSWSFSRIDTVLRNGQKMLTQRSTQCTLLADSSLKDRSYHRIAFSTLARLEGSIRGGDSVISLKGMTSSKGTLFLTPEGIPSRSSADIESEMQIGNVKAVKQRGTVETTVE
jgi:hypothetical protein